MTTAATSSMPNKIKDSLPEKAPVVFDLFNVNLRLDSSATFLLASSEGCVSTLF
jgi:hypothetical protein